MILLGVLTTLLSALGIAAAVRLISTSKGAARKEIICGALAIACLLLIAIRWWIVIFHPPHMTAAENARPITPMTNAIANVPFILILPAFFFTAKSKQKMLGALCFFGCVIVAFVLLLAVVSV